MLCCSYLNASDFVSQMNLDVKWIFSALNFILLNSTTIGKVGFWKQEVKFWCSMDLGSNPYRLPVWSKETSFPGICFFCMWYNSKNDSYILGTDHMPCPVLVALRMFNPVCNQLCFLPPSHWWSRPKTNSIYRTLITWQLFFSIL